MSRKTIGIFSPGGVIGSRKVIEEGIQILKDRGFAVKTAPGLFGAQGLFPADGNTLAAEFMDLYLDSDVDILLASKGGYGTSRLLSFLDYGAIKENPKVVCGYSDMTAMLAALVERAEIPVCHGPMVTSLGSGISGRSLNSLLHRLECGTGTEEGGFFHYFRGVEKSIEVLYPGNVKGLLKGGNLCVFTTLLGTDFEVDCTDSILFIEDIHEEPYRIHRMMNQLKMNGSLDRANGFLIGQFTNCRQPEDEKRFQPEIIEVMKEFLLPLKKPLLWNVPAGHTNDSMTLNLGEMVEIRASSEKVSVSYL